jgi:hypothetical protein
MKKLGKLTLNEMQDFVPLQAEEQMAMKGGVMTPYQWAYVVYTAWKVSKEIMELVNGSNRSTTSSGSNVTKIYGPDSVVTVDGTKIYYPDSVYAGSGN